MKTLIVYSTRCGFTKRTAALLKSKLTGSVEIVNIKEDENLLDKIIDDYDNIVVGSFVRAGRLCSKIEKFINKNTDILLDKKIGLFITAGAPLEKAKEYLKLFKKGLYENAVSKEVFGGEFKLKKLNFIERFVITKIIGVKEDITNLYENNISGMALVFNK